METLCTAVKRIGTLRELVVFCTRENHYREDVAVQLNTTLKKMLLEDSMALKEKKWNTDRELELLSWKMPKITLPPSFNTFADACESLRRHNSLRGHLNDLMAEWIFRRK
jgi:hypothetical protein